MSIPNWWGDWRQGLTPHTGNLQSTDLIECTMIVGGQPVNTVITGAQILGAVPSGGGLTVGTTAITSGTVGRILFEGTGNVLQESANLFWDNTNSRLGIAQSTPTARIHIQGSSALSSNSSLVVFNSTPTEIFRIRDNGNVQIGALTDAGFKLDVNGTARVQGITTISGTFMNVPAISTTGFYIQPYSANNIVLGFNTYFDNSFKAISNGYIYYINQDAANFRLFGSNASVSAGLTSTMLTHFDFNNTESKLFNGKLKSNSSTYFDFLIGNGANLNTNFIKISYGAGSGYSHYFVSRHDASISSIQNQISLYLNNSTTATGSSAPNTGNVLNNTQSVISSTFFQPTLFKIGGSVTDTATSSAAVEIASTTKGFLPPRMTTTQKNAIATPAAGLVVYDTTLNKLCVRTASAWETITSL